MNSLILNKATFYRNIKDYKFSHKLSAEQKQEIVNKLTSALGNDYSLLTLNNLDFKILNYLNENALIDQNSSLIFLHKHQPICVDLFNGEHLSIVSTGDDCFNKANELVQKIQNKISLAYSDDYGYLMSNLNFLGAGIKLEAILCLDAISGINKFSQVKQNISMLGYAINTTSITNCFNISTRCTLGFSEIEIYNNFTSTISKLNDLEVESIKMLDVTKHDEILDNVNRSSAILNAAHIINVEELTRHLIVLRTGLNLGYNCINLNALNSLQKLVINKKNHTTKEECIALAKQVRNILKGENNV